MKQNDRSAVSGIVFNIQKFSLHDGPGIRTVVFLKGCPLHCLWCANPESQSLKPQILWESPGKALKTAGETRTVEEVMRVVMQDIAFYEESGGGITLSGGEALMQPEFASALLEEAKQRGLDTAIETTGFAHPDVFEAVTKDADHFLIDLKHWDESAHVKWTGVSNSYPLQNMENAIAAGKDVLPRIPVIPGVNDSLEDVAGFVKRLKETGADRVQLLPFHQFGENKYAQLGREYAFAEVKALHREDLEEYRRAFIESGIDAFF